MGDTRAITIKEEILMSKKKVEQWEKIITINVSEKITHQGEKLPHFHLTFRQLYLNYVISSRCSRSFFHSREKEWVKRRVERWGKFH